MASKYIISILLLLTSCQKEGASIGPLESSPKEDSLKLNMFAEPPSLEPKRATYSVYTNILMMMYDGLMRYDVNGDLNYAVAEKHTVSKNGKTYTFFLRDSYWSNGKPVTAHDFANGWKWALDPKNPAPMASHLYIIKNAQQVKKGELPLSELGIACPTPQILVVELEHAAPYFPNQTAFYCYYPSPPAEGVSNGPFVLTEWEPSERMRLCKNARYWDSEAVRLSQIDISFIKETRTELALFEQGLLHFAGQPLMQGLPPEAIPSLVERGLLKTTPALATYYYSINTRVVPMNNQKVRQALSQSLQRCEIVKHITQCDEKLGRAFVPIHDRECLKERDDEHCRTLFDAGLAELGLTRETLPTITLTYNTGDGHHKIAQYASERWEKIFDVQITLRNRDWKTHLDTLQKGDFSIARLMWKGCYEDPYAFLELFLDPDHPLNNTGWTDETFTLLLEKARSSTDDKQREALLIAAEEQLIDQMPIIPIYFSSISYVQHPRLKNVYVGKMGWADFKWAYLEN